MTTFSQTSTIASVQSATATIQIVSTPPMKLPDNTILISWSRRSTEANPVAASERYRAVCMPAHMLSLPDGCTTSKFQALLQATIVDLATTKFTAWVRDNMLATEMPAALLSLDAVLLYWSEERVRQQVTGQQIIDWLRTSATLRALAPATAAVWLTKVPKIAAPSYKMAFTKGQAAAIVSKLAESDLDSAVAQFIASRCNSILTAEEISDEL